MALYLGSEKRKIVVDDAAYVLKLFSETVITNGTPLMSSDGYVLVDSNGLYLTTEESE